MEIANIYIGNQRRSEEILASLIIGEDGDYTIRITGDVINFPENSSLGFDLAYRGNKDYPNGGAVIPEGTPNLAQINQAGDFLFEKTISIEGDGDLQIISTVSDTGVLYEINIEVHLN